MSALATASRKKKPGSLLPRSHAVCAAFGNMGQSLLLGGQLVVPSVTHAHGFSFMHPALEPALRFLLGRTREGVEFGGR